MSYRISPTEGCPESKGWRIETHEGAESIVTEFADPRDAASKITDLHTRLLKAERRGRESIACIRQIEDLINAASGYGAKR